MQFVLVSDTHYYINLAFKDCCWGLKMSNLYKIGQKNVISVENLTLLTYRFPKIRYLKVLRHHVDSIYDLTSEYTVYRITSFIAQHSSITKLTLSAQKPTCHCTIFQT